MSKFGSKSTGKPGTSRSVISRVLYRQFLLRVIDLEMLSSEASVPRLVGQFAGILILCSAFRTVGFLFAAGRPHLHRMAALSLILQTEQSFLAGTMLIAGLLAVVSWDSIFPDRRDVMVLGPLPVEPRAILKAKLAAAGSLLWVGVLSLNFAMGVALPLVAGEGWHFPRVLIAYWVTAMAAALFVYGVVLTIQGISAAVLPQLWFLRLSSFLQLASFALFLAVWIFEPGVGTINEVMRPGTLCRWPVIWFLGLFGGLSGAFPLSFGLLERRAMLAVALVAAGAATSLLLCYVRTMRRTAEQPDLIPRRLNSRWLLPLGDDLRGAVVRFSMRALGRSRQHRVIYAFFLAISFAIAVSTLKQTVTSHHAQPVTPGYLMGTLMMLCLAVVGFRSIFQLPISLRANWVLQVTQLGPASDYIAGTRHAMLLVAVLPVWFTAACLSLCYRPWHQVEEHLVILGVAGSILADASLIGVSKIPFACSYLPGKSNVQYVFWAYAAGFIPLAMNFSNFEQSTLDEPLVWAKLVCSLVLIAVGLRLLNRHRSRSAVLYYEELEPEVITTLGIATWNGSQPM